ncbi:MAG TPA: MarR family transcriptional regulator [Anaerolineaceae bacterium]|jgi:DNA-binding MarR family transcriptional regulator|nr:MarR family transcriptional regulator [Anaerolineaceae bacterium]
MADDTLLQKTVESFWDTIPPVWGRVRENARGNAIQDFNLTLIQFHILRHIWHGIRSVRELAEKQQISRPAISQVVEVLVLRGLVVRKQDTRDRRCVQLELTATATKLLEAVFSKNRRWMAEKMVSLEQSELETIMAAMEILKKTFDPSVR